jgi:hypothetical protein
MDLFYIGDGSQAAIFRPAAGRYEVLPAADLTAAEVAASGCAPADLIATGLYATEKPAPPAEAAAPATGPLGALPDDVVAQIAPSDPAGEGA